MLQYEIINVSEGIDPKKSNKSKKKKKERKKECVICHYWYFKDIGYKFEAYIC